jgi:hypothetical protein
MYGIYAELKVYLAEESDLSSPQASLLGRIESHIEQEVETLASSDFLSKIKGVFEWVRMKHVIQMTQNDVIVYSSGQASQEDWEDAFMVALNLQNASKGTDAWWIIVSGSNEEFYFRQDVMFKQKHALATPSIAFVIRALPAYWMERIKYPMKIEDDLNRPKIEKYLDDYQQVIKDTFVVRDLSRSLRIDLSKVDQESIRENWSSEQTSKQGL